MGTRGYILFSDNFEDGSKRYYGAVYKQFDSYPSGLGKQLKEILNDGKTEIVNGFSTGDTIPSTFNRMGCLAAYVVGMLKGSRIGDIYLEPIPDDLTEVDWTYALYVNENLSDLSRTPKKIMIQVFCFGKLIYDGKLEDMPIEKLEE